MITLLAIDWAVVGIKAGQLILCLSILVVLHEMGHFLPAKWFKCRVEKFYLFFDPWFSLVKKKIGDTVYGIGWLPLGGYVKISGMIDESMDKEQMKMPPQPWEFRSKKPWQRLIIMIGGVTVNLILGFFLFAMILWHWGEEYLPAKNATYGVYVDSLGKSIGLQDGDKIVAVNGNEIENFSRLSTDIILNEAKTIQVIRAGQNIDVNVPEGTISQLIKRKGDPLAYPKFPAVVDSVMKDAKFTSGALQKDDQIIGLNGQPIGSFFELSDKKKSLKNQEVTLTVLRNNTDTANIKVKLGADASIGFFFRQPQKFLNFAVKKYTFFESLPAGVAKGWSMLVMNVQNFKLLFTSKEVKASESLGSFLTIGNMFGAEWDWERFWSMTALLSIVLAFMNILPIPALDGGHVLFTLYEIITGRKPGDKFMEYAQMAGMILLLGVMAYALGLDFWRYLFKH
ncbi:RIP metalloprotease RseP [Niastella populi]|uniref:Zinc metalloprotease n=1 Tax=Niastella populi TaxID=550983 RepID=A0A1V9F8M5_9BACT|nr:RIP metalloprotease RseP [Niastella populi]OQP54698.1 RIP metalloprotease RseP [Niastella populi]